MGIQAFNVVSSDDGDVFCNAGGGTGAARGRDNRFSLGLNNTQILQGIIGSKERHGRKAYQYRQNQQYFIAADTVQACAPRFRWLIIRCNFVANSY
jgi:hypothetical protein